MVRDNGLNESDFPHLAPAPAFPSGSRATEYHGGFALLYDRKITLSCVASVVLALLGLALIVGYGVRYGLWRAAGHLGVCLFAYSMLIQLRHMWEGILVREKDAFLVGRELGRAEAAEVRLHALR